MNQERLLSCRQSMGLVKKDLNALQKHMRVKRGSATQKTSAGGPCVALVDGADREAVQDRLAAPKKVHPHRCEGGGV